MRKLIHLLCDGSWDDDDAILVADDGVSRADDHLAALDDAVALPRLHEGRALLGGSREGEDREAVANELIRVADGAVGHEAADVALLEAQELDVAAGRLPRAN